jgi:phosphoglycolate phosphatase
MAVRLVIFDCDGVLFHSEAANVAFYNAVRRAVGEPPLDDVGEAACHALASAALFQKQYGDRPELLAQVRQAADAIDYAPFFGLMTPTEGLYDVLGRLKRRYRTAMATNRGKTVRGVLAHFELETLFDLAVGVYDVDRPKPHPDMLLKCLDVLDVPADEAVYVGDQPSDAASAAAAGICFVAMGPAAAEAPHRIAALAELEVLLGSW